MGGKSEIINCENMSALYSCGYDHVSKIRDAAKRIEERIDLLRGGNLPGEKGVAYRQALNALSTAIKELSRTTEKASVYMDIKLNTARKADLNVQAPNAAKNKVNYLRLKK